MAARGADSAAHLYRGRRRFLCEVLCCDFDDNAAAFADARRQLAVICRRLNL